MYSDSAIDVIRLVYGNKNGIEFVFIRSKDLKTILLVEDDEITEVSIKMTLETFGYKILTANTGNKAIKIIKSNTPVDLILMDIELGRGIDGSETSEIILQYKELPILFLSSYTDYTTVKKLII